MEHTGSLGKKIAQLGVRRVVAVRTVEDLISGLRSKKKARVGERAQLASWPTTDAQTNESAPDSLSHGTLVEISPPPKPAHHQVYPRPGAGEMAPPCGRAALLCWVCRFLLCAVRNTLLLDEVPFCRKSIATAEGRSRSNRRYPRERVARGAGLSLAKLSQALGNCIAQFMFVLGVQTPNVVSLRDDVHDSHIRLALKRHEEIAPVEQGQGADLFVASIAVSEKRNVRIYLHYRAFP